LALISLPFPGNKALSFSDMRDSLFDCIIHQQPSYREGLKRIIDSLGENEASLIYDCMVVMVILEWLDPVRDHPDYEDLYNEAWLLSDLLFHTYSEEIA